MTHSQPLTALLDQWRREIADLRTMYFDERLAALTARHLHELEQALDQQSNELLTLTEAAKLSGYSEDHLGRLVRDGKIGNSGRDHAPRIRRGDLPLKASRLRNTSASLQYARADSRQIARSIVTSNQ